MTYSFILLSHMLHSCIGKIIQVYSWRKDPPVARPPPNLSPSDQVSDDDLSIALRKDKCQCVHPISSFVSYNHLSSYSRSFVATLDSISLPNTVHEVLSHLRWRSAMIEEMSVLDDNGTWDLVQLPVGKIVIGCRRVFVVKVNLNRSVARLKARLVAKGYGSNLWGGLF